MNVTIQDKGNTKYKLTVCANGDARIKLKSDDPPETKLLVTSMLESAANIIVGEQYPLTMRGTFKLGKGPVSYLHMASGTGGEVKYKRVIPISI